MASLVKQYFAFLIWALRVPILSKCSRNCVIAVIIAFSEGLKGVSSVSFLAYRLERSSEPKAHELLVFKEGCYIASVPLKH